MKTAWLGRCVVLFFLCPRSASSACWAPAGATVFNDSATAYAAYSVAVDAAGDVVVAGDGGGRWRVQKYDAGLTTLLATTDYSSPGAGGGTALSVAVDGSGSIYVVGDETGVAGGLNWRVRKYDAGLTTLLASTDYDGPGGGMDAATSVAVVGSLGYLYVAGYETAGGLFQWRVHRYDLGLTTLEASTAYTTPSGPAQPYGIAVNGSAQVLVCGYEYGSGANQDWRVIKYSYDLTTILSTAAYDGPGNGNDVAYGLALDAAGNVVVAGFEYGTNGNYDWRVTRYSPGLTTVLGSTGYDGPGSFDYAYGVAVDGSGNIVVAGFETGTIGGWNWRVHKYDAGLTSILATTAYNGPGNATDVAWSVAVQGAGDVVVAGSETDANGGYEWRALRLADVPCPSEPSVGPTFTAPVAYPNPFRPARGDAAMTLAGLPPGALVRIYTLRGRLVRELAADANGMGQWDGLEDGGRKAGSGVYVVLVEQAGSRRTLRVVVQR